MSHLEQRLEHDLQEIREAVARLGAALEGAIDASITALLSGNRQLAYETILRDQVINRQVRRIDRLCYAFVARHLPSAGHLRFVSSVLRINVALERIGDYAVTICRETIRMSEVPWGTLRRDFDVLAREAARALHQSLEAFRTGNPELARGTRGMAKELGRSFDEVFDDLVEEAKKGERSVIDLFALLLAFNRLSRICDQAENICEEVMFSVLGETKPPKVFRVLFLDAGDGRWARVGAALAAERFGNRMVATAGLLPGQKPPAEEREAEQFGIDVSRVTPQVLELIPEVLGRFHIVICLTEDLACRLSTRPYHTVFLHWDLAPLLEAGEAGKAVQELRNRLDWLHGILIGEPGDPAAE
ncbi:MAG: hypothetical protein Kow00109_14250 [Acidobacteriota bacterium]